MNEQNRKRERTILSPDGTITLPDGTVIPQRSMVLEDGTTIFFEEGVLTPEEEEALPYGPEEQE